MKIKILLLTLFSALLIGLTAYNDLGAGNWGDGNFAGKIVGPRIEVSTFQYAAQIGFIGGKSSITAPNGLGQMTIQSSFTATGGSFTFRGGNNVQGATIAVGGIQFLDAGGGLLNLYSGIQMGPGLELLCSTAIEGTGSFGISTMSCSFSSSTRLYIVINSTPNGGLGGDLLVSFNRGTSNNRSPMYAVWRSTSQQVGTAYNAQTSSLQAIGIPVFGQVNQSSVAMCNVEIKVFSNRNGGYKVFEYSGTAVGSATVLPMGVSGGGMWCMHGTGIDNQITNVEVTHIQDNLAYSQGITHKFGSVMQVWGRRRD